MLGPEIGAQAGHFFGQCRALGAQRAHQLRGLGLRTGRRIAGGARLLLAQRVLGVEQAVLQADVDVQVQVNLGIDVECAAALAQLGDCFLGRGDLLLQAVELLGVALGAVARRAGGALVMLLGVDLGDRVGDLGRQVGVARLDADVDQLAARLALLDVEVLAQLGLDPFAQRGVAAAVAAGIRRNFGELEPVDHRPEDLGALHQLGLGCHVAAHQPDRKLLAGERIVDVVVDHQRRRGVVGLGHQLGDHHRHRQHRQRDHRRLLPVRAQDRDDLRQRHPGVFVGLGRNRRLERRGRQIVARDDRKLSRRVQGKPSFTEMIARPCCKSAARAI